eukprot:4898266-Alexandrium_andersonii.AAC.1
MSTRQLRPTAPPHPVMQIRGLRLVQIPSRGEALLANWASLDRDRRGRLYAMSARRSVGKCAALGWA